MIKIVILGLVQYYKRDKKDFISSILFIIALVTFTYFGLLFASVVDK